MKRSFGTDGIRGRVPDELGYEDAAAVGYATGRTWPNSKALVGCDTRDSCPLLAAGIIAGLAETGVSAEWLGVATTPAIEHAAKSQGVAGIVITASHNLHPDNGIKVFAPSGLKPDDATLRELEAWFADVPKVSAGGENRKDAVIESEDGGINDGEIKVSESAGIAEGESEKAGSISPETENQLAADLRNFWKHPPEDLASLNPHLRRYADSLPKINLQGRTIVVDCANGAAAAIAPAVIRSLGAEVIAMGTSPDGTNINTDCGSTAPEKMAAATREYKAHCGFALDGDGDRVVMAAPNGKILEGDNLLAILARDMQSRGELSGNTVVITPMTNLGLRQALTSWGLEFSEVPVGDRHIQRELTANNWSLGGEPSGHIIAAQHSQASDGLLAALLILEIMLRTETSLDDLAELFRPVPQTLTNVPVSGDQTQLAKKIAPEAAKLQATHKNEARIVVRPSGTEPVLRIMVESETPQLRKEITNRLTALATELAEIQG